MNHELFVFVFIVLTFISGCCLGAMFCLRKVGFWRIKWIEMEHDLARLQGRKPRNISEVDTGL